MNLTCANCRKNEDLVLEYGKCYCIKFQRLVKFQVYSFVMNNQVKLIYLCFIQSDVPLFQSRRIENSNLFIVLTDNPML